MPRLAIVAALLSSLAAIATFSGCGSSSTTVTQVPLTLTGNWQFTMAPPSDGSFLGGLQGGFLVQSDGSVKGSTFYSVAFPTGPTPTVCNSGTATITGTINGQTIQNLTASAGGQIFTLSGTLDLDSSTMSGTYTSTVGPTVDGNPCGTAQPASGGAAPQWSASLVPSITGAVQGSFHSVGGNDGLTNQDFAVTGALTQGPNAGASSATVSGNLSLLNPVTNAGDYACFTQASVSGLISGDTVSLQIIGSDGSTWGQIGAAIGATHTAGLSPVTVTYGSGGPYLSGVQPTYLVASPNCAGTLDDAFTAGDFGNICFALNGGSACNEPVTLAPASLSFTALASPATSSQKITLTNNSSGTLNNLSLALTDNSSPPNFTETDNCGADGAPSDGLPFSLISQSSGLAGFSCVITIKFAPSCTTACASPVTAELTLISPESADDDKFFAVPITGKVTSDAAVAPTPAVRSHRATLNAEHYADIH